MSWLLTLLTPLHPIVTRALLFVSSNYLNRLEEIVSKYLPVATTTAAIKKCLGIGFTLAILRKVNNLLSE